MTGEERLRSDVAQVGFGSNVIHFDGGIVYLFSDEVTVDLHMFGLSGVRLVQAAFAMALYSASTEERETVCCFLDFQDMRDLPKKTQ
uniref:Uncharacterized protein n=1 Tax=Cannabis sativa TaxID=3483 RepID=A0A803PYV5_CANSA